MPQIIFDKTALIELIRTHGVSKFAHTTGLTRQQAYNYAGTPANPGLDTFCRILTSYGFELEDVSCFFKYKLDTSEDNCDDEAVTQITQE